MTGGTGEGVCPAVWYLVSSHPGEPAPVSDVQPAYRTEPDATSQPGLTQPARG